MSNNKFIIKIDPTELVPKTSARIFYYLAFWVAAAEAAAIAFLWNHIPLVIPLFFTEPWGEGRLAPRVWLFLLPAISFASLIINLILGKNSKEESQLLSYSLAVATLTIVLMLAIAIWGILQSVL